MAAASPEASEIRRRGRQRLIGAVALVLLAVVFVPMLLDSDPRPVRTGPTLAIPNKDQAPPLPAPVPPTQAPTKAAQAPQAAAPSPPAISDPAPPPPALEGFAVQVGAFRDEAKLKQAREKLAAAGVPHYTERLDTSSGPLTRLRAGPFPTREAADGAAGKLKAASLPSRVVPLP
jgi:DedD protein